MADRQVIFTETGPEATVRTEINFKSKGFEEVLCSPGVMEMLKEKAEEIAERANANYLASLASRAFSEDNAPQLSYKQIMKGKLGYKVRVKTGKAYGSKRDLVLIYSADADARIAESEDKALSRALYE